MGLCWKVAPMVDRRAQQAAVAAAAGILFAAFHSAAVANAAPESGSAPSAADGAVSGAHPARASGTPARHSTPTPRIASVIVPRPAAVKAGDLAPGTGAPAPSALEWTMLAAARNEIGRRSGAQRAVPGPAAVPAVPAGVPAVPAAVPPAPTAAVTQQPIGQAVSPLGTPDQIAAETVAMRTVHSLPVVLTKAALGLAWRIIGDIQYSQVGGPDKANLAALGNAVDEWAMGSAFQTMILNSNQPTIITQVAPPHRWYGINAAGSRILYDNPDTIYRFVGVNYASQYVITGRMPENDPKANFSVLTGTSGKTVGVLEADQLDLGPDRTFVITVSGAPAEPGQKNHIQITPDTTLIAIRDTLWDWNSEHPMQLSIHRTAGPPDSLFSQIGGFALPGIGPLVAKSPSLTKLVSVIPPLPSVPPILRGSLTSLLMLRGISEESKYIKVATTDPATGDRKAPNVFTDPRSNASFLATQLQSAGYFQLSADQALVLTIKPNKAGYFVAPVTNDWTITDDYWNKQTSLNIAQAKPNPDGTYTLVVSPTEPNFGDGTSVWNWVSTGGLNQGTMAIRFQSIDPTDPLSPTVSSRVVALGDLPSVLPAGTALVTPAERAAQIAARAEGFDQRFAPYPQTGTV
jgi:hypothetical protein